MNTDFPSPLVYSGLPSFSSHFRAAVDAYATELLRFVERIDSSDAPPSNPNVRLLSRDLHRRYGLVARDICLLEHTTRDGRIDPTLTIQCIRTIAQLLQHSFTVVGQPDPHFLVSQIARAELIAGFRPGGLVIRLHRSAYPAPFDTIGWLKMADENGGAWINPKFIGAACSGDALDCCTGQHDAAKSLSQNQQAAYLRLVSMLEIRGSQREIVSGVWARPFHLIVGPSGSGKSTLVRQLAKSHNLPILHIDSASWNIRGSRMDAYTLDAIQSAVTKSERGIIFIDELDKFQAATDWMRLVQQELMALLDSRLERHGWGASAIEALRNWLIVGGATWQAGTESAKSGGLGFSASSVNWTDAVSEAIRIQSTLPRELLMRFNSEIVVLAPPSHDDVVLRIEQMREEIGVPPLAPAELDALSTEAIASGENFRWLEAYLCKLLGDAPVAEKVCEDIADEWAEFPPELCFDDDDPSWPEDDVELI